MNQATYISSQLKLQLFDGWRSLSHSHAWSSTLATNVKKNLQPSEKSDHTLKQVTNQNAAYRSLLTRSVRYLFPFCSKHENERILCYLFVWIDSALFYFQARSLCSFFISKKSSSYSLLWCQPMVTIDYRCDDEKKKLLGDILVSLRSWRLQDSKNAGH